MRIRKRTKIGGITAAFTGVCLLAAWLGRGAGAESDTVWYSIIPPLLAIVLAFLTRRVLPSLGIAILVGGLLSHVPARR